MEIHAILRLHAKTPTISHCFFHIYNAETREKYPSQPARDKPLQTSIYLISLKQRRIFRLTFRACKSWEAKNSNGKRNEKERAQKMRTLSLFSLAYARFSSFNPHSAWRHREEKNAISLDEFKKKIVPAFELVPFGEDVEYVSFSLFLSLPLFSLDVSNIQ